MFLLLFNICIYRYYRNFLQLFINTEISCAGLEIVILANGNRNGILRVSVSKHAHGLKSCAVFLHVFVKAIYNSETKKRRGARRPALRRVCRECVNKQSICEKVKTRDLVFEIYKGPRVTSLAKIFQSNNFNLYVYADTPK